MLLGYSCVECTTSVMEYGYRIIDDLILGLKIYMKENNFKKASDFIGLAKDNLVPNDMLDKDIIEYPKFDYSKCVGCQLCKLVCPTLAIIRAAKRTLISDKVKSD